ncbi:hypothetical protein [Paraburkholderia phenazinium]|uniref:hypothetical protein n=1 Tax=Paraburkholderia phenazinium TaxID=60549 RepID=UPI00158B18D3|nr:hypothetical protein [Paraburkholderia phenazinium]
MVTLRLVGGTDVTGIPRRRPRAKPASKNSTNADLTPIHVGAILAAQIEAHETEAVRSLRRRAPQKMMKAEAQTTLQSIALAGTDLSGLPDTEMSIEPSEAATPRLKEKAREALRALKLPGQQKTVAELRDDVSRRCRNQHPKSSRQWAIYIRLQNLLYSSGITLRHVPRDLENWDPELQCVVTRTDDLVAAHPEFKPYAFVLKHLEF